MAQIDREVAGELLTAADVGRETGRTPAAIRKAADEGRIDLALRTVGGVRLFTREAVDRFRRSCNERHRG